MASGCSLAVFWSPFSDAGISNHTRGTPDVVGVYRPIMGDMIQFPIEIVTAEIKISPQAPVVAFGQAVAYRLFSAKTYIVMPTTLAPENLNRLESLCMLFGVGWSYSN